MATLSKEGLVALVRELLLLEADEVLAGSRDDLAGDSVYDERKLHVARRLYEQYVPHARRELRKQLRQLPTMANVLTNAKFAWSHRLRAPKQVPDRQELLRKYADPHELELARLRLWAVKQLKRVRGQKGTNVDLVVMFVYLSLRDVCDWERLHVEQFGDKETFLACMSDSHADSRSEEGAAGEWTVLTRWEQYQV